jgi:DNA-binding transcriptional LysR family regulator
MDLLALNRFDLNTLVTLKVLLDERHVTRAAEKLSLTQSAVSRILAKLRQDFDDPLLVKSGKHLSLTPKAERLYLPLSKILEQITGLLLPESFDPLTAKGSIRIATNDYGSHALLPRLIPLLNEAAPGIQITALDSRSNLIAELEENKVDLILGGDTVPSPNIYQRIVASDGFQGLVRKGHPYEEGMTLEQYLSLNHVMISPKGTGLSEVDELLKKKGLARNVTVRMPHFFPALEIIANTDFMILLPEHFVRRYVDTKKFTAITPPFDVPTFDVSMFWHARMHHEPLHSWFRKFVYEKIYERKDKLA